MFLGGKPSMDAGGSIHAGHAHLDLTSAREGAARRGTMLDAAEPIKAAPRGQIFPVQRSFLPTAPLPPLDSINRIERNC